MNTPIKTNQKHLHYSFIKIDRMMPSEYENGGEKLLINYHFPESPFGDLLVASTEKGICDMAFTKNKKQALHNLKEKFPNAKMQENNSISLQNAISVFWDNSEDFQEIKLHLKGTDFQLKVWEMLLEIPLGQLATYGEIAGKIGNPKAQRAVGTAIGKNPIAFLIPCHRVVQSSGKIGGYRWGTDTKSAIIGWEKTKR